MFRRANLPDSPLLSLCLCQTVSSLHTSGYHARSETHTSGHQCPLTFKSPAAFAMLVRRHGEVHPKGHRARPDACYCQCLHKRPGFMHGIFGTKSEPIGWQCRRLGVGGHFGVLQWECCSSVLSYRRGARPACPICASTQAKLRSS